MFGLLVCGRLVDTAFRQVDSTHVVIDVPDAGSFNHIVVFLTGQTPFPEGAGGGVYFSWPDVSGQGIVHGGSWQYLGMISNEKPSAIFKVSKRKANDVESAVSSSKLFGQGQALPAKAIAQVGISVEPLSLLHGLHQATVESEASQVPKFMEFTQKMVQSLFNYTASYAMDPNQAMAKPSDTYVPYSAIQQWCTNFERRIKLDPYFWSK